MDSINILLTGFKLLPIIQGIVCGGLFAAGLLLSWMLRSNLHGEMETEKEFARQHKISYYQIDQGHKILFFWLIKGKILHICGGTSWISAIMPQWLLCLKDTLFSYSIHMPDPLMLLCKLALRAQTCTRIRWQYVSHNRKKLDILSNKKDTAALQLISEKFYVPQICRIFYVYWSGE